ncbi:MAG: hypothetical protein WDN69_33035 [Aliidongia sp.]
MMTDLIEIPLKAVTAVEVDSRLEHLASVISGNGFTDGNSATLLNLRELYGSDDPVSIRFVENLLQCAVCTSSWRCDHCDYRQVASELAGR